MPYCMNMWSLYMLFMDLFLFSGFNRFMHFLSTYAYSWINLRARRTLFDSAWYRVGLGGRCKPGMALTTIGEAPQWGWVADWSSCRTISNKFFSDPRCAFIRVYNVHCNTYILCHSLNLFFLDSGGGRGSYKGLAGSPQPEDSESWSCYFAQEEWQQKSVPASGVFLKFILIALIKQIKNNSRSY